jgi:DNA repair protein RecO (recombination protein O)
LSYHIYTTNALVLSHAPRREADRVYSILTQDFGLIRASAGGVRKESSKLRGSLEPFSFSSISLVRGKEFWRITSAKINFTLKEALGDKEMTQAFARVLSLVERLLVGEATHPEIYNILEHTTRFVRENSLESEDVEIFMLINILSELGYISRDQSLGVIGEMSPDKIALIKEERRKFIEVINKGLRESSLIS